MSRQSISARDAPTFSNAAAVSLHPVRRCFKVDSAIWCVPFLVPSFASCFTFLIFAIHQVQVRRSHSHLGLLAAATAALLAASRVACLSCCIVTTSRRCLVLAPGPHALLRRRGASLACQCLSDQVVYHPDRAAVSLATAQVNQLGHLLVRTRWRIQVEREDGQAVAVQRQLHIALEIS